MISDGLEGRGMLADTAKTLGPEQAKFWAKRHFQLLRRLRK